MNAHKMISVLVDVFTQKGFDTLRTDEIEIVGIFGLVAMIVPGIGRLGGHFACADSIVEKRHLD